MMQIDSFYFVPVQPCFHLTLSLYGSFLSYKDGNIFFAFLNFLRIQNYQKSLFSNRRHFSTMLNSVKSELCAGIYCKSERQVIWASVMSIFFVKVVLLLPSVRPCLIFPPKDLENIRALKIRMRCFFLKKNPL